MKVYVTLGQGHAHHIAGKIITPNHVAVLEISEDQDPRTEVQRVFGTKYSRSYRENDWNESEQLQWYPLGYILL